MILRSKTTTDNGVTFATDTNWTLNPSILLQRYSRERNYGNIPPPTGSLKNRFQDPYLVTSCPFPMNYHRLLWYVPDRAVLCYYIWSSPKIWKHESNIEVTTIPPTCHPSVDGESAIMIVSHRNSNRLEIRIETDWIVDGIQVGPIIALTQCAKSTCIHDPRHIVQRKFQEQNGYIAIPEPQQVALPNHREHVQKYAFGLFVR